MSHNTKYAKRITDISTFCGVAEKFGKVTSVPEGLEVRMYGGNTVKDAVAEVKLHGWQYPIAITKDGDLIYDHWGSATGTMDNLHELVQEYNIAATSKVIPYEEIQDHIMEDLPNGDKKLVLVYE
jgi:hypothetical protein